MHDETSKQEISARQDKAYKELEVASLHNNKEPLLLPSVVVPDELYSTASLDLPMSLTGIDRVSVVNTIQLEQKKTKKALEDAQYYRNLSEKLRRDKCQLTHSMHKKIELVRNFWRNNIKEGQTRSGKMVQKALRSAQDSSVATLTN